MLDLLHCEASLHLHVIGVRSSLHGQRWRSVASLSVDDRRCAALEFSRGSEFSERVEHSNEENALN
jgi:hypothetical protein